MYDNKNSLGARLAEERGRLGLSQQELGEACDSTRESIGKYERDVNVPGGEVLMAFGRLGMDIQYIVTGLRSVNFAHAAEEAGTYKTDKSMVLISKDEAALLDNYRHSSKEGRDAMIKMGAAIAQPKSKTISKQIRKK